jgi:hypothetical protein
MAWTTPNIPVVLEVIQTAWGNNVRGDLLEISTHDHTTGAAGNGADLVDPAAGVGGFRTLGTGATQARAGNHTH